jgi:hypothetical protein
VLARALTFQIHRLFRVLIEVVKFGGKRRERETERENQSTLATRTEYHALSHISHVFVVVVVVFSFFPRRRESSSSSSSSRRRGVKTKSILLREDCIFPRVDVVTRKKKKKKRRRR